ncbi:MAG: hypothetical protein ACMZ66_12985 [Thalassospira sp.]|uniref:hypothetical protein n=1 Tax=Thalassospira sp. TaxID=1912094 RepID=UPI003A8C5302
MSNSNGELKSFGTLIQSLEEGQFHSDLTDEITAITKALQNHVMNHGGSPKGKLDLSLKFQLKSGVITISTTTSTSLPVAPRSQSILWADDKGNLCRQNPRQRDMFTDVNAEEAETRAV